jgi:hypothetical protein
MIETVMLKLLVTVWVAGGYPVVELIHTEYPITNGKCEKAAKALKAHAIKGAKVSVECVPEQTRGA